MEGNALLLSVRQSAMSLSCCERTIWYLIRSGELQSVKIGRLRRIPAASLARFIAKCHPTTEGPPHPERLRSSHREAESA